MVANNYLSSLGNHLGKKIIDSAQKNVEIPKNHNYANVFTLVKSCLSRSLLALADHFANLTLQRSKFD